MSTCSYGEVLQFEMAFDLIFLFSVVDHLLISHRALATEDFKVPDKMVGFSKWALSSL